MTLRKSKNDEPNDDLATSAGHQSIPSSSTNESPPGPGPVRAIGSRGEPYNFTRPYRVRSAYSPRTRLHLNFKGPGRTKQSFKDECNINTIMRRYMKTGVLDHVRQAAARYEDVTGADYQNSMNLIAGANTMFHMLPSAIRARFENNPRVFLEFMENPANAQEAIKMGLREAEAEPSTPPSERAARAQPASSPQAGEASQPGEATAPPGSPAPAKPGA